MKSNLYAFLKVKFKTGEILKKHEKEMYEILKEDATLNMTDSEESEDDDSNETR